MASHDIELRETSSARPTNIPTKKDVSKEARDSDTSQAPAVVDSASGQSTRPPDPRTPEQKWRFRVQFAALCWTMILVGWNDGSTGPLLPRIREVYDINFTVVSLIFVFACVGFFSGALLNVAFGDRIGFGKVIVLASTLQIAAYIMKCVAPPFPAFVVAFVINGVGIAVLDAQINGYVASYQRDPETKMGILHAAYGLGALCAPLAATQFSQMTRWSFHYLVSLAIAISNTITLTTVFRLKDQDECLLQIGQEPEAKDESERGAMKRILSLKSVHVLAFFLLFYVGIEVTIGGWIVTYIIEARGGGPSSGYISSGFFAGLALGRIVLLWLNTKIGETRVVYLYGFFAIGLEFVVWFVPSLIGGGVAVSLAGLVLGPLYPIAMNHASRNFPKWIRTGAIGWIAGFGQAGSAALPFITGVIANKHGIVSLQPFLIAMMSSMLGLWAMTSPKFKIFRQHTD